MLRVAPAGGDGLCFRFQDFIGLAAGGTSLHHFSKARLYTSCKFALLLGLLCDCQAFLFQGGKPLAI